MREIKLKDCLAEWPPTNAAAVCDAPDFPKSDDIITHAKISKNHLLVLSLKRDGTPYVTNVPVREMYLDQLTSAVKVLSGKTIGEALTMVLHKA